MGLLSKIMDKLFSAASEGNPRPDIITIMSDIRISGQYKAKAIVMSPVTADLWRIAMSERLGREVIDTPMPSDFDGAQLFYDDELPAGTIIFEDAEKNIDRKIDIYESMS